MFGCTGGSGISVYLGGLRRWSVSWNMTRTGSATTAATLADPDAEPPAHDACCSAPGSVVRTLFALKQLPEPDPAESARSAQPLRTTTLCQTRLPRGRQGGPGSRFAWASKVTNRAVRMIATP